jgi:hypothetical protein
VQQSSVVSYILLLKVGCALEANSLLTSHPVNASVLPCVVSLTNPVERDSQYIGDRKHLESNSASADNFNLKSKSSMITDPNYLADYSSSLQAIGGISIAPALNNAGNSLHNNMNSVFVSEEFNNSQNQAKVILVRKNTSERGTISNTNHIYSNIKKKQSIDPFLIYPFATDIDIDIDINISAYKSSINMEIEIESAYFQQLRTFLRLFTYIYVFYISF